MIVAITILAISLCLSGLSHGQMSNVGDADQEGQIKHEPVTWHDFKRVCYFRMDPKVEMDVRHIDGNLCTHVIFAFCRIDARGMVIFGADSDERFLEQIVQLKEKYPHLKVLVSLYNEGQFNGFVLASQSDEIRDRLAKSAIEFMDKYKLDGMDLDWEFPNFPPKPFGKSKEHERTGLTKITERLRESFGSKYLLTLAVAAQNLVVKRSYELEKLSKLADWLNIMTYDFYLHKSYTPFTGPNSPLYSMTSRMVPILRNLSVDSAVRKYIKNGIAKEKMVMGIPTYARGFRLRGKSANNSKTDPKPFKLASGKQGGKTDDYFDFKEVCAFLRQKTPDTRISFDEKARVPYMITNGTTWVSYEDENSVKEKVEYAINMGLGGYMTWNLNSDNFDEPCYENDSRLNILHESMLSKARTMLI